MSYNQKPPGPGGSGMGGGPPNGPNNSQQVAKTIAGIQQQMQSLVHGQNAIPQSPQADINVFLQQQRLQILKQQQQQLYHFQQQMQQQQQQQQNKDHSGSSGEPLALTRTPAAAELLSKTYQQHHQQQPNGSSTNTNSAINQFQQQLQALQPNIMQQLQAFQMQMQQQQQQQQHFTQPTPQQQHHAQQQAQLPIPQQQLHGQNQQQQKALSAAAVQQLQTLQQCYLSAVQHTQQVGSNKIGATPPPPPPLTNQMKPPNLPPSTQITPVLANTAANIGCGSLPTGSISKSPSNMPPTITGSSKQVAPSISLLPAKHPATSPTPTAAHQQNKFGAGKSSPIISAIPPPFPSHHQKPSNTTVTPVPTTLRTGTNPDSTAVQNLPQRNPVSLTKQTTSTTSSSGNSGTSIPQTPVETSVQHTIEPLNSNQITQPKFTPTTVDLPSTNKNLKSPSLSVNNKNNESEHSATNTPVVEPLIKEKEAPQTADDGKTENVQKPIISESNEKKTMDGTVPGSLDSVENKETVDNTSAQSAEIKITKNNSIAKDIENETKNNNEENIKPTADAPKSCPSVDNKDDENVIKETNKVPEEKQEQKSIDAADTKTEDEIKLAAGGSSEEKDIGDVTARLIKVNDEKLSKEDLEKADKENNECKKEKDTVNDEIIPNEVETNSVKTSFVNQKDEKAIEEKVEPQTAILDSSDNNKSSAVILPKTNENTATNIDTKPIKKPLRQSKSVKSNNVSNVQSPIEKTPEKSEKASSSRAAREDKRKLKVDVNPNDVVSTSPSTPVETKNTSRDRKSQRHRLKTILYQSPLPELAYITKLSASEASNSPKPMSVEDKLILFYKNEYMAVRNAEGTFYLCQTMQNVYRSSPRISIRWLSEDNKDETIYIPDFYDHTDRECVLTTVELKKLDKGHLRLPEEERTRIESILKKALDVEKGIVPRPELSEENPDGLDISLYKDESQIEKKGGGGLLTVAAVRKSRRSINNDSIGTGVASPTVGKKRSRGSVSASIAISKKLSAKKRKSISKRKKKSKGSDSTDEDNDDESSDESPSDKEYKPSQKKSSSVSASKSSPRAQRSPLAKARAASPITPTTSRTKQGSEKTVSSSRSDRATKRKSILDESVDYPSPAKRGTNSNTKSVNSKNRHPETDTEAQNKNSTNDVNNSATKPHSPGVSTSNANATGHNRHTRSRK
ncbi:putative mediator of RNA polymerase II transcription subunit 26 [Teleopsis dalmanni]|uniref:putative mediator of RNA polymerase II transcription subunit 26 n=1 Tax=Teleopsis dalmanni TaxID=139649 RepID=UPI0018CCBEF1|nr:putative mediator of RNA polymerase II transcription subunit 26 [Teleopsis dalmanni]